MQPEEVSVTSYDESNVFTIVNELSYEITAVRLMHFKSNDNTTELFIADKMGTGVQGKKEFKSQAKHHDHWSVTYQVGTQGYMCRDMDQSMKSSSDVYSFSIVQDGSEVYLKFVSNGKEANKSQMQKIYDCVKS